MQLLFHYVSRYYLFLSLDLVVCLVLLTADFGDFDMDMVDGVLRGDPWMSGDHDGVASCFAPASLPLLSPADVVQTVDLSSLLSLPLSSPADVVVEAADASPTPPTLSTQQPGEIDIDMRLT